MPHCIEDENNIQNTSSTGLGDGIPPASSHRAPPNAAPATDTFSPFFIHSWLVLAPESLLILGTIYLPFLSHPPNKSSLSATFTFLLELRLYVFLCLFILSLPIPLECIFCEGEEYNCLGFPYISGGRDNAWHIKSVQ